MVCTTPGIKTQQILSINHLPLSGSVWPLNSSIVSKSATVDGDHRSTVGAEHERTNLVEAALSNTHQPNEITQVNLSVRFINNFVLEPERIWRSSERCQCNYCPT